MRKFFGMKGSRIHKFGVDLLGVGISPWSNRSCDQLPLARDIFTPKERTQVRVHAGEMPGLHRLKSVPPALDLEFTV